MKLLFIISGSIAAKKSLGILKTLKDKGIYVNCILTDNAKKIIDLYSIKISILGKIYFNSSNKKNKMHHIELTRNSNLIIVCPATANIIAKLAHGYANDLASTTLITSNKKILIAPAMNVTMWENITNLNNVKKLQKIGIEFIGPEYGLLKCKEIGIGRLSKVEKIVEIIMQNLNKSKQLSGTKCIVTAGPTIELIDSIRYISNHSSGKQGYEIAKQLSLVGANVILISGPTNISPPLNIKNIKVKTANEMNKFVQKNLPADIFVSTAAVCDVRPAKFQKQKLLKTKLINLSFLKNPDIIKNVSLNKKKRPKLVIGFAAETKNIINNSLKKIKTKGCDWIVGNEIGDKNKVFGSDYNKIVIVKKNKIKKFKKLSKIIIAKKIIDEIINDFNKI